ncbi:MAG: type II toxin-antitoxin system VapC family toxin [Thermodesulfobacteriota bacterium]|jgi:predicted nucleic acid-binding protein
MTPAGDRLIETTILVDVFRGKPEAVAWVDNLPLQGRWVSVITYFELLAGCRNRREQRTVAREMRNYHVLLLTEDISRTALSWFERFHLSRGVGFLDSLIGATAFHQGLPIATLNTKHFEPLPGIRVERPY